MQVHGLRRMSISRAAPKPNAWPSAESPESLLFLQKLMNCKSATSGQIPLGLPGKALTLEMKQQSDTGPTTQTMFYYCTVRVTAPVVADVPDVPVTVMV